MTANSGGKGRTHREWEEMGCQCSEGALHGTVQEGQRSGGDTTGEGGEGEWTT